jgi:hypothetical protein
MPQELGASRPMKSAGLCIVSAPAHPGTLVIAGLLAALMIEAASLLPIWLADSWRLPVPMTDAVTARM